MDPRPIATQPRLTRAEAEAAAVRWEALADEEQRRLDWDRHAIESVVLARVELYRQTAHRLRTEVPA